MNVTELHPSPIEARFLLALSAIIGSRLMPHHLSERTRIKGAPSDGLQIYPQFHVLNDQWAADFFIVLNVMASRDDPEEPRPWFAGQLIVELDGHEFHERTKEQAERDRARDRRVQSLGIAIFRFTGREVHRNASACAEEVFEFLKLDSERKTRTYHARPLFIGQDGRSGWWRPGIHQLVLE